MAYGSESLEGRGQRGGRLQDDSRAYREEVEEEPTDLDRPLSDGLDDDELEEMEPASPLAEDAAISAEEVEEDEDGAEASETKEEDEETEAAVPARRAGSKTSKPGGKRAAPGAAPRRKAKTVKLARA